MELQPGHLQKRSQFFSCNLPLSLLPVGRSPKIKQKVCESQGMGALRVRHLASPCYYTVPYVEGRRSAYCFFFFGVIFWGINFVL
jgi:hypothetical protein